MSFKGKPRGRGAGDMSKRTEALGPAILLIAAEVQQTRRMNALNRTYLARASEWNGVLS